MWLLKIPFLLSCLRWYLVDDKQALTHLVVWVELGFAGGVFGFVFNFVYVCLSECAHECWCPWRLEVLDLYGAGWELDLGLLVRAAGSFNCWDISLVLEREGKRQGRGRRRERMCECLYAHTCYNVHGHLMTTCRSLCSPFSIWVWMINSGFQVWWQEPLLSEPSHWR